MVLDGETVIWNRDRLDFDALQQRMVTSKAALPAVANELPASFVAFDVLAVAGQDTRGVCRLLGAGSSSRISPGAGPHHCISPPSPGTWIW